MCVIPGTRVLGPRLFKDKKIFILSVRYPTVIFSLNNVVVLSCNCIKTFAFHETLKLFTLAVR